MQGAALRICAVVIYEVRPFGCVFLETLIAELFEKSFVKIIDIDHWGCILKLCPKLRHF